MTVDPRASAVIADAADPPELLQACLEGIGLWSLLADRSKETGVPPEALRIVIKPDLSAFAAGAPTATDPRLVEGLIDTLQRRGFGSVALAASEDSSAVWAENRSALAVADILGYRFQTDRGFAYEIADLANDLAPLTLPAGSLLYGSDISQTWRDAHVRIIFAKNKTDERDAYALSVASLIDVLPLGDKDYYYRYRFDPGVVACELLRAAPPHLVLIDAVLSGHGSGGRRAPEAIETRTMIASRSAVLADFTGALKMGVDPSASKVVAAALKDPGLPARYRIEGNLAVYPGWRPAHPMLIDAVRRRDKWIGVSRAVTPWLQEVDHVAFPLKNPLDTKANEFATSFFRHVDDDLGAFVAYVLANLGVGWIYDTLSTYRVLASKDALRQRHVALGIDPQAYGRQEYEQGLENLEQLQELLRSEPFDEHGLRWRYVNEAVVFETGRYFPVRFEDFVSAVDVAKTIQHMNDYLGGVVVPVQLDDAGRVTHQAERNLYLPQPNYLALSQGDVIDVTKLEYAEYERDRHRMAWRTIKSENGSAMFDDGIVSFARQGGGTFVTIFGRQLFTLPPFWQAFDLDRLPTFKKKLVTHAYVTFFFRTFSNFEALLEGRSVRLGTPWHEPDVSPGTEPLLTEAIAARVRTLLEEHGPALTAAFRRTSPPAPAQLDDEGFRHFAPAADVVTVRSEASEGIAANFGPAIAAFFSDLATAARDDLAATQPKAPGMS